MHKFLNFQIFNSTFADTGYKKGGKFFENLRPYTIIDPSLLLSLCILCHYRLIERYRIYQML